MTGLAQYVNSSERRLLGAREAGDAGWWGSWVEMAFNVSRANPFVTTPRGVARLEQMAVCAHPVPIQNQFYEYLDFSPGPQSIARRHVVCLTQAYSRNNAVTFVDLSNAPQSLRIRSTDPADFDGAHRVLLQGTDQNGSVITSQDGFNEVQGVFVALASPFADAPLNFNTITGIQKDATSGYVTVSQVDPVTGAEVLLVTMEPSETTAWYRRYYMGALPNNCCQTNVPGVTQITAMAKLDHIDVITDTDYTVLQNLEALTEECQSIRYSVMDTGSAKQMAQEKHLQAIRLLQGELVHFLGRDRPALEFKPFGSARLECQQIGIMF